MKRIERRIFHLNDLLTRLATEQTALEAELAALRLIDDDAQRDAALGHDRLEATSTRADVRRFEKTLEAIANRRTELADRRLRLLDRMVNPSG